MQIPSAPISNQVYCKSEMNCKYFSMLILLQELDDKTCSCVCNVFHKSICKNKNVPLNPKTCECVESSASHGMSKSKSNQSWPFLKRLHIPINFDVFSTD